MLEIRNIENNYIVNLKDADNVEVGKFVIIAAAGPHPEEDPDNSKLFVRDSEGGFTFVNDLSGSQGIQGPTEWEKITDRPTSLPASDVYDWAKAEEKPPVTKRSSANIDIDVE